MVIKGILLAIYLMAGFGAYKINRDQENGPIFSIVTSVLWFIPVTLIYVLAGLGSKEITNKVNKAIKQMEDK